MNTAANTTNNFTMLNMFEFISNKVANLCNYKTILIVAPRQDFVMEFPVEESRMYECSSDVDVVVDNQTVIILDRF